MQARVFKPLVKKLAANSERKPDMFFVEGYLLGLGINPDMVVPSQWFPDLFGELTLESETQIQALMAYYNHQMTRIMEGDLKLPPACALSKSDLATSLAAGAPLPSYCLGMLKAIALIDERRLDPYQRDCLDLLVDVLQGFSSLEQAEEIFANGFYTLEAEAHYAKRLLTTHISEAIESLRFSPSHADNSGGMDVGADEDAEIEAMMNELLAREDKAAIVPVSRLIAMMEETLVTPEFIEANTGVFWLDPETRPYMILRARRAWLNFHYASLPQARDELEDLLRLNPNDNQANRYLLMNAYALAHDWDALAAYLRDSEEDSLFTLSARALMSFAREGDSVAARRLKADLNKENKYFARIMTGQLRLKDDRPGYYSPGGKEEVGVFIANGGKKAWLSVDGSLFWLRR
jgi:uncharacterized protein YecA (UPF0149 family)